MKNQDYRHVCRKDLKDYFKRSDYFADLSKNEKDLIRNNLGLSILELSKNIKIHTYEELKNIVAADALELNNLYLISDFQTIYKSGDKVLGYTGSEYESKTYSILLQPVTNSTFNKQATIIPDVLREEDLYLAEWVIEYDFKNEPFEVGDSIIYSKGKITYLKDHNNNSAYYDFHNIKFERDGEFLTTFEKSELCKNNHLDVGCYNIIFKNDCVNNTFKTDCINNTFEGKCLNSEFLNNTSNNIFQTDVNQITGQVMNIVIVEDLSNDLHKELVNLGNKQVLVYLDEETLTHQIKEL